jgi:hypothetical protein
VQTFVEKTGGRDHSEDRHRWEDNIKMDLTGNEVLAMD